MSMFGDDNDHLNEMYALLQQRAYVVGAVRALQEGLSVLSTFSDFAMPDLGDDPEDDG